MLIHIRVTGYKGIYNVRTGFVGKQDGELTAKMCGSPQPTDRAFPTLFKQMQRKYFFDQGIEFVFISSVKVFFPTCVI
jgi:hypothetical protein